MDADPGVAAASDGALDTRRLKQQLRRSLARQKLQAALLVAPLFVFVIVGFVWPIASMLLRSVENSIVSETLPETLAALDESGWTFSPDGDAPSEAVFEALHRDIGVDLARERADRGGTRLGQRLNYEASGFSSLFRKSFNERRFARLEPPYREAFIDLDDDWGDPETWAVLLRFAPTSTDGYLLNALDLTRDFDGALSTIDADEAIHLNLFGYTIWMSLLVTMLTLFLGYPIAYLLANLSTRTSSLLLILVLLPFWTSLLVRTSAWVVLLQTQGVLNDFFVLTGLNNVLLSVIEIFGPVETVSQCAIDITQLARIGEGFLTVLADRVADPASQASMCARDVVAVFSADGAAAAMARGEEILAGALARDSGVVPADLESVESMLAAAGAQRGLGVFGDERFLLIFNAFGVVVAMTHILLPFMIMPLYSVMKTISPSYVRAAKSLGATNATAFWRVYFPNTLPGIGAGVILVFILSIGYYITPQLIGGQDGAFISSVIANHIRSTLNWGLACALAVILLAIVGAIYFIYDRLVGFDNVKLA